jgi:DNA polymerase-4
MHGEIMHRYARGIDGRKLTCSTSPKSISRETTFSDDTLDIDFLKATLHYLGEKVGTTLRKHGKRARCVTLKLRYTDFESVTRSRTLKEAVDTDRAIFEVGRRLMEKALGQRAAPVRLIGIGVSSLTEGRQLDMFDPRAETLVRLNGAIDSIRSRYGFTAVEVGRTLPMREAYSVENRHYRLETPSLSR